MVERLPLPLFAWVENRRRRSGEAAARSRRAARAAVPLGCLSAVLGATLVWPPAPRLVWNASASAPVGLYRVTPGARPRRGELALIRLPHSARDLAARRGYLPANVPAIKRVTAVAGDMVCASRDRVSVAGYLAVARLAADRQGRPLPRWNGCIVLAANELFLLNPEAAGSFDSRYFGPVGGELIVGRARLLWAR